MFCRIGLVFSLIFVMAIFVACGDTKELEVIKEIDVPVEKIAEVVKEIPAPQREGSQKLVVYSGRSESLVGPIIEQFQDAAGIGVSVKYGKTSAIAATLLEEGGNSPADVFFAQDPGGLGATVGMLTELPDGIIQLVPDWARSPDDQWVGISGRARVVVYNTDNIAESDLPASLRGFTEPKWKGRIGWAPNNGSFQSMVTAMRVAWGDDETLEWLKAIQANEPSVFPKNTAIVAAAGAGEIHVGFVNHYYLHRFLASEGQSFAASNFFMDGGGPGSIVLVAGAGILKTADNPKNAEKFLKFILSKVAQQYFADQTYEYPLVEGVKKSRLLPEMDGLNKPSIDMASLVDLKGTQDMLREVGLIE